MRIQNQAGMQPWPRRSQNHSKSLDQNAEKTKQDGFQRSTPQEPVSYSKPVAKTDAASIQKLQAQSEAAYGRLRDLVEKLLARQGHSWQILHDSENLEIEVDEIAAKQAQDLLVEGAEFSPEAVSQRIVSFAQALAGDNPEAIPQLREAIEAGFAAAAALFGGQLPDISFQTYELVMDKLDGWERGLRNVE